MQELEFKNFYLFGFDKTHISNRRRPEFRPLLISSELKENRMFTAPVRGRVGPTSAGALVADILHIIFII